jgi:predicted helicase
MKQYYKVDLWGETDEGPDPVIHFYEDFLKEYDADLRKKMGAFYTPLAVVRFIVRSVDYLLEKEFGLTQGLADNTKTTSNMHRVQVLDPAVGTGTFLSAVVRSIYMRLLKNEQEGRWPAYVHNDLLPRLHGFEIMMAPYTIAHLKLSMAFKATGFKYFNRRLGIYLTNSLEESTTPDTLFTGFGLAESIAQESQEAAVVKNQTPIMVVVGNPPYAGESSNVSYTGNDVYKVEPGGGKLKERNSKWLSDDYVKFIRYAESLVEKTGEGIVAMITAHGYLDNPTFRGMRFHLMKSFSVIYVLDLHGNANKKERAPDGGEDKNIFEIKQGVAIFVGIKRNRNKNDHGKILRADCFGPRLSKLKYLDTNSLHSIEWKELVPSAPNYEWVVRDEITRKEYSKGFSVSELFLSSGVGFVTARDEMAIQYTKADIEKVVNDFQTMDAEALRATYNLRKDTQDWKVLLAKEDVIKNFSEDKFVPISYRPFDTRWTFYTGNSNGFHCRARGDTMRHFLAGNNIGLITVNRSPAETPASYYFLTQHPYSNGYIRSDSVSIDTVFPLYRYAEDGFPASNLKREIVTEVESIVGKVSPEDIFYYVYAVLYSPTYRNKYKELLKTDFPRVPFPKDAKRFRKLVTLGAELRSLHLLESPKVNKFITTYPVGGSNVVEIQKYKSGKVFINEQQYFGNIPDSAWRFYIGGYQPAQKWLKDRKNQILSNSDIEHYQRMIVALVETEKIMQKIEAIPLGG